MELRVHQPERVAREHSVLRHIVHDEVVVRVPARVQEAQHARTERHLRAVIERAHAVRRDAPDRSVERSEVLGPVDRRCARHQFRRVDDVARCAWVGEQRRARARLHECVCTARVVEVNMRDDHVAHVLGSTPLRCERGKQLRHGVRGVGLDERALVARDAQVGARELGLHVVAVDGEKGVGHGTEASE